MAEGKTSEPLYRQPANPAPREQDILSLSQELGFTCTGEELTTYTEHVRAALAAYHRLDQMGPEPKLGEVRYPRTVGRQPRPDSSDNPHNAWAWKCDIPGAREGILVGKTVVIKDNVPVAGVPMMNGCHLLRGYIPDIDATVVTRILENGGHIVGKSVCENLCLSANSFTSANGTVTNPHNEKYSSGGSSSGTAALIAAGCCDVGIGGDQGGSIRIPSSWCGLVGLKPTYGLVPYTGAMSSESTLDHLGPMARNVRDCALLLQAIAGYDGGHDHRQHPNMQVHKYAEELNSSCSGIKIAAVTEGFDICRDEVTAAVKSALKLLSKHGVQVDDVSIPIHKDAMAIFMPITAEGGFHTANGVGIGHKGYYNTSLNDHMSRALKTNMGSVSHTVKFLSLLGVYVRKHYPGHYYCVAQNMVHEQRAKYDEVLKKYDVLVIPTTPTVARKLVDKDSLTVDGYLSESVGDMLTNTAPFDTTGHPALTINCGYTEASTSGTSTALEEDKAISKLPIGMMIIGRHYDEQTVLNVARAYEVLRDGSNM